MNENPKNRTEKELLDEAMEKWPEELEQEVAEINRNYNIIEESYNIDVKSEEEILKYCSDCTVWDDFVKEWLK